MDSSDSDLRFVIHIGRRHLGAHHHEEGALLGPHLCEGVHFQLTESRTQIKVLLDGLDSTEEQEPESRPGVEYGRASSGDLIAPENPLTSAPTFMGCTDKSDPDKARFLLLPYRDVATTAG